MDKDNVTELEPGLREEVITASPLTRHLILILIFILPVFGFLIGRYLNLTSAHTETGSDQINITGESTAIETPENDVAVDSYVLHIDWQDHGEIKPIEFGIENIENGIDSIYDVGYITNGPLTDNRVYLRYQPGMIGSALYYFSVIDGRILDLYNFPISGLPTENEVIQLSELDTKIERFSWSGNYPFERFDSRRVIGNDPLYGEINLMLNNCILSESPDGYTAFQYRYKLPFEAVRLNNGSDIFITDYDYEDYSRYSNNNSSPDCIALTTVDQTLFWPEQRLSAAGESSNGDIIYTLSNIDDPLLKTTFDAYTRRLTRFNVNGFDRCDIDYNYSEFIKTNPILFWYDAFDRLVMLTKDDFINCLGQYKGG